MFDSLNSEIKNQDESKNKKNNNNPSQDKLSLKEEVFDWLDTSVKTMAVALFLFTFILSFSTVHQESMLPTLQDSDKVIIYQFMYKPKYKDVVVVTQPNYMGHNLVKRVIATEGQTVDIDTVEKKVYIDGVELDEPYIYEPTAVISDVKYPITVPEGNVFVMGDNRNNSLDSRDSSIGMIDNRYVRGRVIWRITPFSRFGVIK